MQRSGWAGFGACILMLALPALAQQGSERATETTNASASQQAMAPIKAKIEDLGWLAGHWEGTVANGRVEEICSDPRLGEMMCVFRALNDKQVAMLELITFQELDDEVELRVRHFGLGLENDAGDNAPIVLKLARNNAKDVVFIGAAGAVVQRSSLFRSGTDAMEGRIDFVGKDGKPGVIEVHWRRVR